jgi:hypothetical protein
MSMRVRLGGCLLGLSIVIVACGGEKKTGGRPTPPDGAVVRSVATKPFSAAHHTVPTSDQVSAGACGAANVDLCGCLPKEQWYNDGTGVYDMVCCLAEGDAILLHACGDGYDCDDAGAQATCR